MRARHACVAQPAGGSEGGVCPGANAAKRAVRVLARGRSSSPATSRSILIEAAVATCCQGVCARPRSRGRRRPQARPPWDRVPSPPAWRLEGGGPSSRVSQARAVWRAAYWAGGGRRRRRPCWRDGVQSGRPGQGRHCCGLQETRRSGGPSRATHSCHLRAGGPWGHPTVWGCPSTPQGSTV
jgi:hypothetical protein